MSVITETTPILHHEGCERMTSRPDWTARVAIVVEFPVLFGPASGVARGESKGSSISSLRTEVQQQPKQTMWRTARAEEVLPCDAARAICMARAKPCKLRRGICLAHNVSRND